MELLGLQATSDHLSDAAEVAIALPARVDMKDSSNVLCPAPARMRSPHLARASKELAERVANFSPRRSKRRHHSEAQVEPASAKQCRDMRMNADEPTANSA